MPPAVVKTVKELIYWQYAKIIAESAGIGKKDYGFVMNKFKQLKQGSISWNEIREYIKEREYSNECIFCGATTNLTLEHLLPQKYNGPNTEKNLVWICKSCNSKKGSRRLYEHFAVQAGVEAAKYGVPRIAEGKYLKFAYESLKENNLLETTAAQLSNVICPKCDRKQLCIRQDTEGKLSPFCIDGMLTLCFREKQKA
ncbi:MAG: HNH endonuclease [Candidatus Bathyarchaeia archaeon]|jgi:Zn finger protein HypA/HybF involved in hydrogenase expression